MKRYGFSASHGVISAMPHGDYVLLSDVERAVKLARLEGRLAGMEEAASICAIRGSFDRDLDDRINQAHVEEQKACEFVL